MRNKLIYSIAIVALLMGSLSCNKQDFLTPSQIPEFPWTDLASFERGAVAPYNYLVAGGWADALGVSVFMDIASSDLGAIAPTVPPANAPWGVYAYRTFRETAITPGSKGGGRQYDIFNNMYLMINASNDALSFIDKAGNGDIFPGVPTSDETVKRIKAELLFNRARAYFYLVAQFCPPYNPGGDNSKKLLPYKAKFTGIPDELRKTELGSSQEIYDLIVSDLTEAKTLMPKSYNQEGRANYYAICGELARIYFMTGKHAEAKLECSEILNSGLYPLQSDVMAAWNKAPGEAPASECIMEFVPDPITGQNDWECTIVSKTMPWGIINGGRGEDWNQCSWVMFYMSNFFMKETGWMVDPPNDYSVGPVALTDKRYNNTYIRLEGYIPKPDGMDDVTYKNTIQTQFQGITWPQIWLDKYFRGADCANTKQPLYRSAEFYLTRAAIDCEMETGDWGEADLNTVRNRAGLSSITRSSFPSKDDWFNEIHRERMREMGVELGDRVRYLMSLRLPIGLGDRPADGSQGAIANPPYADWYFRIPEDEVNSNAAYPPGFVQE
jgi:starch-binding outer membrane protein, SusD/RagB family